MLGIGQGRFTSIQKKLNANQSLHDLRGKHDKHVVRLTDNVKTLIRQHCDSIPHSESHYTREDSELNYFDNPDLN